MRLPLSLVIASVSASAAFAQGPASQSARPVSVRVGPIASAQECTVYEGVKYRNSSRSSGSSRGYVAGSGSGYASAYGGGGSSSFAAGGSSSYSSSSQTSFETFFFKDCTSHFEGMRVALQAALASSGTITVGPGGYVVTGRVEDAVPTGRGVAETSSTGNTYGMTSEGMRVTMSITVADRTGRIVFGAPVVAELETGSAAVVRDTAAIDVSSGEGLYSLLQRQVAMIAARKVAFHFAPLMVVQGGGRKVQLNYGGQLLETGSLVTVTSRDGVTSARYRIVSVGDRSSLAEQVGDADSREIGPGSGAVIIEKNDPAANQRVLERVDLP